ncbi:serine/threonine-protein kinase bud32, partial [Coemansia sp. RSA 2603]
NGAYTPLFLSTTPVPTTTPLMASTPLMAITTPLVFSTATPGAATRTSPRAPLSESEPIIASTRRSGPATPAVKTPSRRASRQRRRSSQINPDMSEQPEPTFELDALTPMPSSPILPVYAQQNTMGPPSLVEIAKAGLVFKIFNAYHKHRLQPTLSATALELSGISVRFEPLFRKAKLNARLEYCSSLSSMFEADHDVSQTADAIPTDFDSTIEFFEEQNELLAERRDELLQLIAKTKQKCLQEAPSEDKGRLAGEIKELRAKLADIRREREAATAQVEALGSEIQSLRSTSSSFGLQFTEKKGLQNILLAINGLQLTDAAEDHCEFVYDTFSKIHLDSAAEFTSLHPDIDWSAVIRDSIDSSNMSTRQYTISVMKTNAVIKKLLEDIKHVKQMTFVDLQHNGGIQVRIQFFSREHRQRFYLNIVFNNIDAYRQIHQKPRLEWTTEVVYGNIDMTRLNKCVAEARGAEARVYKTEVSGKPAIAKQRFSKKYRHPDLDRKLTRGRLNQEARSLKRCLESGIRVPQVIRTDKDTATLYIEFIEGPTLKEWIFENTDEGKEKELMSSVGRILYQMHANSIIHGDLTTSNIIVDVQGDIVLIDFGLSQISAMVEDKAVDLYVLERAFISTHPESERLFAAVLQAYESQDPAAAATMKRLEDVRQRGRKRDMTG